MDESPLPLREEITALKAVYASENTSSPLGKDEEYIAVSPALKHIAFAYERIRNILDPNEEHILRQGAIERILTRRLREDRPDGVVANSLLQELIRAQYIKPLPVSAITPVESIIFRARLVLAYLDAEYYEWFISLTAIAVDRIFFPQHFEHALTYLMYSDTYRRMAWGDSNITELDRGSLLYTCCRNVLYKPSDEDISFFYFTERFPSWTTEKFSTEHAVRIASDLSAFWVDLQHILLHPSRDKLTHTVRSTAVPYRIIADIITEQPDASLQSKSGIEMVVRQAIQARADRIHSKIFRRALHSIMFLFITKFSLSLLLELTYEIFILQTIHWLALGLNVIFHPFLLFAASITVRMPGDANTQRIVEQVYTIITGQGILQTIPIFRKQKRGLLTRSLFVFIYSLLFLSVFYGVIGVLVSLNFSWIAIVLFIIFLALTSFFAMRIRRSLLDITLVERKEGALVSLFGFLILPVLEFGQWLATKIANWNIFLFTMDLFIEAPFKLMIDVGEEWFSFVRERRQEIE